MSSIGEKGSLVSELYGRHRSFLCFYAMGYVDSYAEAEDIVHSVFEKMLSMDISLKDTSAIDSYLISAVRNSCLNHISRKKVHGKYASHILSENEDSEDMGFVSSRIEAVTSSYTFSRSASVVHSSMAHSASRRTFSTKSSMPSAWVVFLWGLSS